MRPVVVTSTVDDDELAALRRPQDHFVLERPAGPDRFAVEVGPFTRWDRRLDVDPAPGPDGRHRVTATVDFALALPFWGPLLTPFIRHNLRRTRGRGERRWWMPARTDARSTTVVGVVCVFALIQGYLGVLLSQTNAFFKAEFGASSSEVADAQIAVRIGAFAALAVATLADRWGRRRVLLLSTAASILLTATGAFAPNLWAITVSQGLGRTFSTVMFLITSLMAAEEVAAGARASALSVLTLAAGLGAGAVAGLLWVGGLSPSAWRYLYLVPLPLLAALPALARRLAETRRFEVFELHTEQDPPAPAPRPAATGDSAVFRRRLLQVGAMLLFFYLFVIPFGGFTNDYLLNERHFEAWQLTFFQVLTTLPAGASVMVGGRLADTFGRHRVATVGVIGGVVTGVLMFFVDGWAVWACSTAATVLGGLLVPSLLVYPTEMFPTGARGRAQGLNNLAAVAGAVIGLKLCGVLADELGSFGPPMLLLGLGGLLVVPIVLLWFPETSGVELEELNPGDEPPPVGDDLARLDRRWEDRREHGQHLAVHEGDEDAATGP